MTEEEIIKVLNYQLNMKGTDVYTPINYDAIQGLLDLYNKQKEEIDYYKSELEKETSTWTKLEKAENLISKDKIRHILLKFQNEYGEDLETTDRLFIGKEVVQYGEDMLDEIAKELDIKLVEE